MKTRVPSLAGVLLLLCSSTLALFAPPSGSSPAAARAPDERPEALSVTAVSPATVANDLAAPLGISGTDFLDGATAQVGAAPLGEVTWISSTLLQALLPWGLAPGVYTLTVTNPGGASASLPAALTVVQGLGAWTPAAGPEGGTIEQVLVNPVTPTLLLALSADDGLFRSRDGGASWELASAELPYCDGIALGADPDTVYAAAWGQLWRSDDMGTTWHEIPIAGADEGVNRVYPHPTLADTVWAIAGWDTRQLFRSVDRGASWVEVTAGITDTAVTALGMDPGEPLRMALGTASGNVFLSTDGGDNWAFAAHALTETIGSLTYPPSGSGAAWVTGSCYGVARSTGPDLAGWIQAHVIEPPLCNANRGATPLDFAPLAWGDGFSRTVFLVGTWPQVSYDGGTTWDNYGPWWGTQGHDLAPHPTLSNTAYVGCQQQGVQLTTDAGSTWQVLQHGLTGIAPEGFAVVPNHPDTAYALESSAIGVYKLEQGGADWRYLPLDPAFPYTQGEAGAVALDPFQEGRLYLAADPFWVDADIFVSTDGGESWPISATLPIPPEYASCYNSVRSLEPDPFSPGILLAGATHVCGDWSTAPGSLYLSADYGGTWIRLLAGQPISSVNDLAWDWGAPGVVYAGTGSGVLRSTNGGLNWSPADDGLEPGEVRDVEVEPAPPYRILVLGAGNLHVSEDQGQSWSLLDHPGVESLHFAPGYPPLLYAPGQGRLYVSGDGGASWGQLPLPPGQGLAYTLASGQRGARTVLYAAMAGGVFRFTTVPVTLAGRLTDADTGLPIAGATIRVDRGFSTTTDLQGAYTLTLASGSYDLRVSAAGYVPATVADVVLLYEPVALDLTLWRGLDWAQVNEDGFGSPEYGISVLETFQPAGSPAYLYAGTWGATDTRIWRTSNGRSWELAGAEWVSPTTAMNDAQAFGEQLYLGLSGPTAQLWRTDGTDWEPVDQVGFGDVHNLQLDALAVFSDVLYAAVLNDATGTEIWASDSGDPGTWVQVNADGFGAPGTGTVGGDVVMDTFQGHLYVGLSRDGVGELWRSEYGTDWTAVFTDGLGSPGNGRIAMAEFNGDLYISFRNVWQGGEVWRSGDGLSWEAVLTGGLGEAGNGRPYGLIEAGGALYIVFSNLESGAQVWRTLDGEEWRRCNGDGWDDPRNTYADYNDKAAAVFRGNLYIGVLIAPNGGEVWMARLVDSYEVFLPVVNR